MARKSLLGLTIFTFFGLVLLLGLGTWQVERLQWKEGLIAERQAAVTAPPAALPDSLAAAAPLEFRHVEVTGRFLVDHELYLNAVASLGTPGFEIITPLLRADGSTVLVDRGFVPPERKDPATRAAAQPAGEVTVTGLLRLAPEGRPGWFVPDNRPDRNEWFYVDLAAMAKAAGTERVLPFYVDADATPNPGGFPVGGQTPLDLPNNHLQYAVTWYALAGALVVFYILVVRRRRASPPDRPGVAL